MKVNKKKTKLYGNECIGVIFSRQDAEYSLRLRSLREPTFGILFYPE